MKIGSSGVGPRRDQVSRKRSVIELDGLDVVLIGEKLRTDAMLSTGEKAMGLFYVPQSQKARRQGHEHRLMLCPEHLKGIAQVASVPLQRQDEPPPLIL